MFSSRVPGALEPNRLTQVLTRLRRAGAPLLDLTLTNPTAAGIEYPESILDVLADRRSLQYEPAPLGLMEAREAVARDYDRSGIKVAAERVVLTSSTSEAYSVLFKLLCAPAGEAVMVPAPSYPLFEHLTELDGVRSIPYRLEFHRRWAIDFDTLDAGWSDRVRAVLAVSPNNPTGSMVSDSEAMDLAMRCATRDAALILDEVFVDYPLSGDRSPLKRIDECLTFRLGGLSKSAGLPQVKLGWIIVDGPEPLVRGALDRLELICDTYLSVSTPVQHAAAALMAAGATVRTRILQRIRTNDLALREIAAAYRSVEVLPADAGWSAVLRVPSTRSEEDLAIALMETAGVIAYPGFFFDFPQEAFLVVSLLPEPAALAEGIRRVMELAHA
ncbi:MAG: pyridoxal phosphate-dependent aminotransferase [Vicinamibacterales bacterium]